MPKPSPDLLPCPFCGSDAVIIKADYLQTSGSTYLVKCSAFDKSECHVMPDVYGTSSEAEIIERWNTREPVDATALMAAAPALLEALESLVAREIIPEYGDAIMDRAIAAIAKATP